MPNEISFESLDRDSGYIFREVNSGALRRPSHPWTRFELTREPPHKMQVFSQPYQEIIRPFRFGQRDQLTAVNTDRPSTSRKYIFLDPTKQAVLEHFGRNKLDCERRMVIDKEPATIQQEWNKERPQALQGLVPKSGTFVLTPNRGTEDLWAPLQDVEFHGDAHFGRRYVQCVDYIAAHVAQGLPKECSELKNRLEDQYADSSNPAS
uniref:Uncharacterized protein n=1 Tax=Lotharella oceanica TaxID=641309 RepID=A0A7S2X8T5_9EUKA|mmetsp:Transcript_20508/g.38557  ORF Transcript_20508/g.38557 Transcript_20508/m.38557 type:complete len:207 (+) Transcript_20508:2-622(+)